MHRLGIILLGLAWMGIMIPAHAGEKWRAFKAWIDSSDVAGCDTSYVALVPYGFIAHIDNNLSGNWTLIDKYPEGQVDVPAIFSTRMLSRPTHMVSAGLSYRGWGLSYSHDFSEYGDTDFSTGLHGKWYGLEYRLHRSYSQHGTMNSIDTGDPIMEFPIDEKRGCLKTRLINAYYVFERQRFSHPAATCFTTIQRRSCGSWIAILNYMSRDYSSYVNNSPLGFSGFSLNHLNLGAGYAYNYVFAREHCLLHGLVTPTVTFWHRNRLYYPDKTIALSEDMSMDIVGHVNFVYNSGRLLLGMQSVLNYVISEGGAEMSMKSSDWTASVFAGVRF